MTASAAPLTLAAVAWNRDAEGQPFFSNAYLEPFTGYFDLRDAFLLGLDIDKETQQWWQNRSEQAKTAITARPCEPVADVVVGFLDWVREAVAVKQVESLCLWCQGQDFDVSILRSLCRLFDIRLEEIVPHTSFRDCRTVILETARIRAVRLYLKAIAEAESLNPDGSPVPQPAVLPEEIFVHPSKAYQLFDPLPAEFGNKDNAHDALYDCRRSSWNVWQALNYLNQ